MAEFTSLKVGLGFGIERDMLFGTYTRLSTWLEVADEADGIRAASFSATSATFGCLNFSLKPEPSRSEGQRFTTIARAIASSGRPRG